MNDHSDGQDEKPPKDSLAARRKRPVQFPWELYARLQARATAAGKQLNAYIWEILENFLSKNP